MNPYDQHWFPLSFLRGVTLEDGRLTNPKAFISEKPLSRGAMLDEAIFAAVDFEGAQLPKCSAKSLGRKDGKMDQTVIFCGFFCVGDEKNQPVKCGDCSKPLIL